MKGSEKSRSRIRSRRVCVSTAQPCLKGKGTSCFSLFLYFHSTSRFALLKEHKYCFTLRRKIVTKFSFLSQFNIRGISNCDLMFFRMNCDTSIHKLIRWQKCESDWKNSTPKSVPVQTQLNSICYIVQHVSIYIRSSSGSQFVFKIYWERNIHCVSR
jgi:hypothetical protein